MGLPKGCLHVLFVQSLPYFMFTYSFYLMSMEEITFLKVSTNTAKEFLESEPFYSVLNEIESVFFEISKAHPHP